MQTDSDECSQSPSYVVYGRVPFELLLSACQTFVFLMFLGSICVFQAYEALSGKDHHERTLLMHAAATGKAPLFREVFHAMEMGLTDEQVIVVTV